MCVHCVRVCVCVCGIVCVCVCLASTNARFQHGIAGGCVVDHVRGQA